MTDNRKLTELGTLKVAIVKGVPTLDALKSVAGSHWRVLKPHTEKLGEQECEVSECKLIISGLNLHNLSDGEKEKAIRQEREAFAMRLGDVDWKVYDGESGG